MSAGPNWPIAIATHAVRDAIGRAPGPNFSRVLSWASEVGFDGIDLSDSVVPFDQPGADLEGIARAVTEHGLRIAALNLLRAGLANDTYAEEGVTRIRHSITAAAALKAPVLNISLALPRQMGDCNRYRGLDHAMGGSRQAGVADFETTARHLRPLVAEAAAAGVALSIELHHASLADNSAATLRLWQLIGDNRLGVNPDLVNAYWAYANPEEDWRDTLRALAPLANLWHIKNVTRVEIEPGRRVQYLGAPLAWGDIDYRWAVGEMWRAGFMGWTSIERGTAGGDALKQIAEGLPYLRDGLFHCATAWEES